MFLAKFNERADCHRDEFVTVFLSLAVVCITCAGSASAQTLTTLVSFDGTNGGEPEAALIADANGNLFGTTYAGGTYDAGTVFEIVKTGNSYAASPTTLVSFDGTHNRTPAARLLIDANGNLFGTTAIGGVVACGGSGCGTVFEIVKAGGKYASAPKTLVQFNYTNGAWPFTGLIADANGNLFGTTYAGGTYDAGTVFEVVKTGSSYANDPTTLVTFDGPNGANPRGDLLIDANGDLFGTTQQGGSADGGTVFEVVKTGNSYANTPTTLANLYGTSQGGLIADANGNLFGTTFAGGNLNAGTVFEIVKTGQTYASTPIVLVSFGGSDGRYPDCDLLADAKGDLFGTTEGGGSSTYGTLFEIVKAGSDYASTPTTLINFDGSNGGAPVAGLIADASGNLFGTTQYTYTTDGTVFEVTNSGFVPFTTPFSAFHADLALSTQKSYGYALDATFTTSKAYATINPATEAITLQIANYTVTFPAGSFRRSFETYTYQGTISGVETSAFLRSAGGNRYEFTAYGSPINLASTANPVTVILTIGTDTGTAQVNAIRLP